MVINSNNHSDYSEKAQRCQEYIKALEEERCKIQVFQRELPLCLELVTQAIEACKQQLSGTSTEYNLHGQSECSEQTSTEGPVLEEFIPIKRNSDDEEQQSQKPKNYISVNGSEKSSKKSDWLRSVQLWNDQTPDPPLKEDSPRKVSVVEVKRDGSGGAFHPFKREKSVGTSGAATITTVQGPINRAAPVAAASSSVETGGSIGGGSGGNKNEEKEGQSQRKARRCWSPELHKRFIQALQQLGGSHAATPKQIRELMNVDGLTNDEVKSHLQKYRLHTRRPNSSIHNKNNPQPPQFVVVGGIWVPPPEYAAMASGKAPVVATTSNGIYAPIAALPPPFHETSSSPKRRRQINQSNSDDQGSSHSEGRVHSHSPATSSSTHTTTASLAC